MNIRDWFLKHSPQEQVILLVLGVILLLGILYAGVVHPLRSGLEERQARIAGLERSLSQMRDSAAEVRALRGSGKQGTPAPSNRAPYLLVDAAVRQARLSARNISPLGSDKVRVQFSQTEFNKLVRLLDQLQARQGLSIAAINVDAKSSGRVDARITLERQP